MLKTYSKKEGLGIFFEFTAPRTPQQNSVAEKAFTVLFDSMRTMTKTNALKGSLKYALWAECANIATDLSIIITLKKGIPYSFFHTLDPKFIENLHIFG